MPGSGLFVRIGAIGAIGAVCVALASGALWGFCRRWPLAFSRGGDKPLPGLRVDGVPLGATESVRAQVAARAKALQERRLRVVVREGDGPRVVLESSLGDLGVSVDVDAVTAQVLRLGRTGDALGRADMASRARRGAVDVPLAPAVETRLLVERFASFKDDLDVPPVAARLDLERHLIVPEHEGEALDADAAADAVARAALDPAVAEIALPFSPVAARVTRASLARIDISHVVASFQTFFSRSGDQGPRARNIEVAASRVDGLVLEPDQTVSFNDVVGARSEENGFRRAFEIQKGEMVEGTGGGTCQVASTLHAIAFFGGLDVVQRLPHSRPSGYIPAGLDATVVYPTVDLKVRNPFRFPVVVHASVTANTMKMELLGSDKPADVTFGRQVMSTTPFSRKVVETAGRVKPKRKQKGIDGMDLLRSRVIAFHDGRRKVESSRDTYPPTLEIWEVPPGYDAADLPPLGEDMPKTDDAAAAGRAAVPQG